MTTIQDTPQAELEAARDELERERQHLRRGGLIGTRLHGHQSVEETFRQVDATLATLEADVRFQLARTASLPLTVVVQLAGLRAAKADEGLREHLHELVSRDRVRGEGDFFERDTKDREPDVWPVRSLEEISAELDPIVAEIRRRDLIAKDEAALEENERQRTGILARLGGGR